MRGSCCQAPQLACCTGLLFLLYDLMVNVVAFPLKLRMLSRGSFQLLREGLLL